LDVTLICGEWDERRVVREEDEQGEQRERTTLLQLDWREDDLRTLAIPCDGRRWIAMMVCGDAALASHALRAEGGAAQALLLPPGEWQLAGRAGARLMLAGGEPLGEPVVYRGNFAARDESDLVALTRRYQQGAMGTLTCPGE
jgi:redox-sensitive bicupin YhaK (pirin superfamily)